MFCTNCGAQVDDGNAFCPTCGARLDHPALVNAQQADVPAGSARQALPAMGTQQTQAVLTRPYASRSHARQTTPAIGVTDKSECCNTCRAYCSAEQILIKGNCNCTTEAVKSHGLKIHGSLIKISSSLSVVDD